MSFLSFIALQELESRRLIWSYAARIIKILMHLLYLNKREIQSRGEKPKPPPAFLLSVRYYEDELVGKPSSCALSAVVCLYCPIIPFQTGTGTTKSQARTILLCLDTHKGKIRCTMALQVHKKTPERVCCSVFIRPNTDKRSPWFLVLLYISSFLGPCRCAPNLPPSPTRPPPLFARLEFSSWLKGPGQGTKHTSTALNSGLNSAHTHTSLVCTNAKINGCL